MLRILCQDIGPRPSGSEEYDRSVSIIRDEMEASLPIVGLDTLTFTAWRLYSSPVLRCGSRIMKTYPDYGSPATPEGGAPLAHLTLSPFGRATPFALSLRDNLDGSLPLFNVGKQEETSLEEARDNETEVWARLESGFFPGTQSASVIGTLTR